MAVGKKPIDQQLMSVGDKPYDGMYLESGPSASSKLLRAVIWLDIRLLAHPFLSKVLEYYRVELVNLAPNPIANLSIFVYLCEACLGIPPDLEVFSWFYMTVTNDDSLCALPISPLKLRAHSMFWYIGGDDATKDSSKVLSPDEIRDRIKMIFAREPDDKAAFPWILAIVSAKERIEKLKLVGLKINELTESCEPIDPPTTSALTTTQDGGPSKAGEKENPQAEAVVVVGSRAVVSNQAVAPGATVPEVNESTVFDQMVRELLSDPVAREISSDLRSKDVEGLTSPTGSEPMKRKSERQALWTLLQGVSQSRPRKPGMKNKKSPHPSNFPNCPRIFDDEKLDEAWRRISDRQLETGPNAIYSEYADMTIQNIEVEVMDKEAIIARLKERFLPLHCDPR
uniref:Putative retrotransposon protein n=1 Tax=Phyllostachys edulis TaxID=38705 RepID=D3IVI2_PHYED|nr:putative retrotransposon protein [Phyllostachys edulis]